MRNRLKKLRKSEKLTQLKLAELTGISNQMISGFENGSYNMSIDKIILLADYFKVTIDYLIGREINFIPNDYLIKEDQ